eukprot:6211081-Prymnesium_polylepis.1
MVFFTWHSHVIARSTRAGVLACMSGFFRASQRAARDASVTVWSYYVCRSPPLACRVRERAVRCGRRTAPRVTVSS